jgi:hypothetical protein
VTAEPTRNFFIDGNGQQYTCSESSCQCVPRYGYHGPTARQASH